MSVLFSKMTIFFYKHKPT